jgi:NAD(P)H-hydrate epimerase
MKDSALGSVRTAGAPPDETAVVVDALLGTGFSGPPRGRIAQTIEAINQLRAAGAVVAALDLPSGLDATSGTHAECVVADLTLSFGGVKRGTLLARDCCGAIQVLDIGLESGKSEEGRRKGEQLGLPLLIDDQWVRSRIPPIRYDAHKGTRKHLAIIGGAKGMPGAVVLGARGALRSGIGLVRALVVPENVSSIVGAVPSALISEWSSDQDQIEKKISNWADAIVIGPGLGTSRESRSVVEAILKHSRLPTLLDADALNLFDGDTKTLGVLLAGRKALITPHAAEYARLAGTDVKTVLANRFDIGVDLARALGATVLLKGSPTIVFAPDGSRYVIARGTAALGTGGSGDLLDGIAGTILAQTTDATTAATCAAWVHGRAAELCAYVRGTTLEDVLYALPRAWNESEPSPELPVLAALPAVAR